MTRNSSLMTKCMIILKLCDIKWALNSCHTPTAVGAEITDWVFVTKKEFFKFFKTRKSILRYLLTFKLTLRKILKKLKSTTLKFIMIKIQKHSRTNKSDSYLFQFNQMDKLLPTLFVYPINLQEKSMLKNLKNLGFNRKELAS